MRNVKSSTPMISKAVKVVCKKFWYDVHYIGRESDRKVKKFSDAVLRQGGNCTIDDKVFKSFEFLQELAEMKVIAVRIDSSINDSQYLLEYLLGMKISTMAVDQELSNIACSIDTYGVDTRIEILVKYNRLNKHSLVGYNVGLHLDIFGSNSASFENKVVMNIKSKNRNN